MAVAVTDNFDLQVRRKRVGLTQRDVMKALGLKRIADISDFENGHRTDLPKGKGRDDYERLLQKHERKAS